MSNLPWMDRDGQYLTYVCGVSMCSAEAYPTSTTTVETEVHVLHSKRSPFRLMPGLRPSPPLRRNGNLEKYTT